MKYCSSLMSSRHSSLLFLEPSARMILFNNIWFQQKMFGSSKEKSLVPAKRKAWFQQREKLGSSKNKKGLVSAKRKAWFKYRERLGLNTAKGLVPAKRLA